MMRKSFTLTNSDREIIRGDLRFREAQKNAPVIIICHGWLGFKDWGFFPLLAETLAESGYITITFNFSRNGIGSDLDTITEIEKFSRNTYTHELQDLHCLMEAIKAEKIGKGLIDREQVGLLGHCRGGGLALLYAARDNYVRTVVTWAAISTVDRFSAEQVKNWKKTGSIEFENKLTRQTLPVSVALLNDIHEHRGQLDILQAAAGLDIPVLLIHGDNDEVVTSEETRKIYHNLKTAHKEIEIIEGANHYLGITHPLRTRNQHLDTALDLSEAWFDKHLNM
jgi:uncharacterized protein